MIHEDDLRNIRRKLGMTNRVMNLAYASKWLAILRFLLRFFFHNEIPSQVAKANPRLIHPFCIIIHDKVSFGNDCTLFHCVTIGGASIGSRKGAPIIGNGVIFFPHAMVIGRVVIGDNVIVGAGAVVVTDIPANSIVAGNPARVIGTICAV